MKNRSKLFFLYLLIFFILPIAGCKEEAKNFYTGTVESEETVIQAELGGKIKELAIEEGMQLKKGDLIAVLGDEDYKLQVDKAKAVYREVEAKYLEGKSGTRLEQIEEADARVQAVTESIKGKENIYGSEQELLGKYRDLYAEGAITEKTYVDQKNKVTALETELKSLGAEKSSLVSKKELLVKGLSQNSLKQLLAAKDQAKIALEIAELQLSKTKIKAPLDGVVSQKVMTEGEIAVGGSKIAVILSPEKWVKIYLSEDKLSLAELNTKCILKSAAYPKEHFTGIITYLAERAEFTPKNMQTPEDRVKLVYGVKLKIVDESNKLKPGMPVDVYFSAEGS